MEVINNLFIGSKETAKDIEFIKQNDIKCIVNCTPNVCNYFQDEDIEYMRISSINDENDDYDLDKYMPHIVSFIYKNFYLESKSVLVHSTDGNQKAAIIIACYIMKCTNYDDARQALDFVHKKYPTAFDNGKNIKFFKTYMSYVKSEKLHKK